MYYLMLKIHATVDMNYLCITKRKNWKEYTGSGTYWNAILKKYGYNFSTMLLYQSNDYKDFLEVTQFYSKLFDVSNNKKFANQIPENGYDNGNYGRSNLEIYWDIISPEKKSEIILKRNKSISNNHWAKKDNRDVIGQKISNKAIEYWDNFTFEERVQKTNNIRERSKLFFEDRTSDRYIAYCEKQSLTSKNYMSNLTEEERAIHGKKVSQARLNTSDEDKLKRKLKIQEVYATGKYDHIYEKMSDDRIGIGNPNAKIILWFGKEYTSKDFKIFCKENKLSKEYVNEMFLTNSENCVYPQYEDKHYDVIICPHCKKESTKKPSVFKRWHFDNCKLKGLNNESK